MGAFEAKADAPPGVVDGALTGAGAPEAGVDPAGGFDAAGGAAGAAGLALEAPGVGAVAGVPGVTGVVIPASGFAGAVALDAAGERSGADGVDGYGEAEGAGAGGGICALEGTGATVGCVGMLAPVGPGCAIATVAVRMDASPATQAPRRGS